MTERELLDRLYDQLVEAHRAFPVPMDRMDPDTMDPDFEVHDVGEGGVLAFVGDYVLVALPPGHHPGPARKVVRLLRSRLEERGLTRHMVHPRNFPSVKATRKLGALPVGVDADGYVHYELTLERFRRGQKVPPSEGS